MKAVLVFALLVAVSFADKCTLKIPKRPCAWNVEVIRELPDLYTYQKTVYYFNGQYKAVRAYDYGGNLYSNYIFRPDIGSKGTVFSSQGGVCSTVPVWPADADWFQYFEGDHEAADCKSDVEFNDKKCTRYLFGTSALGLDTGLYVYVKGDDKIIGLQSVVAGVYKNDTAYKLDFSNSAAMSNFKFSKGDVFACPDNKIFDSANDEAVKCAAYTTKAALAVVLAAVLAALLAVF